MNFIVELSINLISFIWGIAKVIIPLMLIMEILKDLKIIDKIAAIIKPMTDFFTINEKSGISMVIGIVFGLLYGAGAIIQSAQEENIDKRSIFLTCIFLSLCHAVVEDTFIFGSIGAKYLPIILFRVSAACIMTFILSKVIKQNDVAK